MTLAVGASLSWLLLLACPLMMVFMHGGHNHGGHKHDSHHRDGDNLESPSVSRGEELNSAGQNQLTTRR